MNETILIISFESNSNHLSFTFHTLEDAVVFASEFKKHYQRMDSKDRLQIERITIHHHPINIQ